MAVLLPLLLPVNELPPLDSPQPSSRSYEALPPPDISPSRLRRAPAPPAAEDAPPAPPFQHWRPPSAAPPPPSAVPDLPQTQGILRKRQSGIAGGWAPTEKREKKKVRVESPRGQAAAVRNGALEKHGRATLVLVPPTPEKTSLGAEEPLQERPDLAVGAVERCIPCPYAHPTTPDSPDMNPSRQHASRILHSFVDPTFATSTSSLLGSGTSQFTQLPTLSPLTHAYLTPGRRGSWLVPVSSALPIPHTSPARWFAVPPPPSPLPSPSAAGALAPPPPIKWTDARLRALWSLVTSLNASGSFGALRAACHIPSSSSTVLSPSASSAPPLPAYVKITADAHLALAIRALLDQLSVRKLTALEAPQQKEASAAGPGAQGKGKTREEEKEAGEEVDAVKWLAGRALVWVDEMGRAVLTA
ncbi:hypothetical protein JCM10207_001855 [Rhodosporidiobolus poonsookiae]